MAVYEGARTRLFEFPGTRRAAVRTRGRVRARRRSSRAGVTLAAILVAFLLGLFYLTQTIRAAATGYDVDVLLAQRAQLEQELQSLEGDIARWGAEPALVRLGTEAGLDRLGRSVRVYDPGARRAP